MRSHILLLVLLSELAPQLHALRATQEVVNEILYANQAEEIDAFAPSTHASEAGNADAGSWLASHLPSAYVETSTPQDFAVASFNIENAVQFSKLNQKEVKSQADSLFIRMSACSVIFLQEYTDNAWEQLRPFFGTQGEHFQLIAPSDATVVDNGQYDPSMPDAFRVAILIDTRYWSLKDANNFVLTKVDSLGLGESMVTHIKNRVAMHVKLSPILAPDTEVDFINVHLDAVDAEAHATHHSRQIQQVLKDWMTHRLQRVTPTPRRVKRLKVVIGGDTNYRAGEDEELLPNLLKNQDAGIIALGLKDTLLDSKAVPTQFVEHLHEGGIAKSVGWGLAGMGVGGRMLTAKRLDILATNLQITSPEEVISASRISDHSLVVAHLRI